MLQQRAMAFTLFASARVYLGKSHDLNPGEFLEPRVMTDHPIVAREVHVLSVCGPVREENQDAGVAWRGEDGEWVVMISDGMGGHAAGREAAEIVVRACLDAIRKRTEGPWEEVLRTAVGAAHAAVLKAARNLQGRSSMGATAALAVVDGGPSSPRLHIAHVGDSRVYLHRGRSLYRLTSDHSLVAQMVRDGLLSEEEAFGHPDSNVIQRAIGQEARLEAEVQGPILLDDADVVLICSDGLHGAVPDEQIGEAIDRSSSVDKMCHNLLTAAFDAGSQDNITIGCIRLVADRPQRRPTRVHD
ncbi:MAG: PP2C family protein-serine/threonine phosphatase [Thermoanaerobaculia bacterium]